MVAPKVLLLFLVARMLLDPGWANLDGKAPVARAVLYPACASLVAIVWAVRRDEISFPWSADALLTSVCLTDLIGNRLDLYNSVVWFDDFMHVLNSALASAAFVLLMVPATATFHELAATAVSLGLTASLGWELFEYGTFLTRSSEWPSAYADTVGDLVLGWLGSVLAAVALTGYWRHLTASSARYS